MRGSDQGTARGNGLDAAWAKPAASTRARRRRARPTCGGTRRPLRTDRTNYDNPVIIPVVVSMSIPMYPGLEPRPGMVFISPESG